ncbi:Protein DETOXIFICATION 47, chloroplastic [Branchiostoma belcheri]|nr:Protein DETOXIFICATION 47, chloroplastic [Branchiostoma belcheri]
MASGQSSDAADGRQVVTNQRQSNFGGKASLNGAPIGQPVNMDRRDRDYLITKHRHDREDGKFVGKLDHTGNPVYGSVAGPPTTHESNVVRTYTLAPKFDVEMSKTSSPNCYEMDAVDGSTYDRSDQPSRRAETTRTGASSNLKLHQTSNSSTERDNCSYEMDAVDGSTYDRSDHPNRRTETTRTTDATSNLHLTRNLYTEADRLSTYFDWPSDVPVSPEDLARQGFFYLGYRDRVECAFCGGVLHQWEAGDDPFIEHQRHYPHCPFVNGEATANVQLGATSPQAFQPRSNPGTAQAISPSHQLPGTPTLVTPGQLVPPMTVSGNTSSAFALPVETQWPRMPDFADEDSRLSTFHNWPRYSPISPLRLARAGFIYTYVADHVRCYWCEGGLKDWQQDDDPWEEHARWYGPECGYVIMNKGMDYIRDIRTRRPPVVQQPQFRWGVETGIIQSALEMGFDEDRIQAVVHNQWQRHNRPFTSAAELLNALLPQEEVPAPFYPPPNEEEEPPFTFQNAPVYRPPSATEPVNEQPLDPETMERELRRLREERQCKVCLSEDACMVFIPCGHLCCCEHCANMLRIRGRRCPLCRAMFQRVQRAFLA